MRDLLAAVAACAVIAGMGAAFGYAIEPDPPPGTTKSVTIVKQDYVCAFTMVRIKSTSSHDYWQVGKKRWCKWVNR